MVRDGVRTLVDAVERQDHLRVLARPDSSLVALAADDALDVFTLSDELLSRGWYAQPQLRPGPFPASLHLSLSAATVPLLPEFLDALSTSVTRGPVGVDPALAAGLAGLDPATLDDAGFDALLGRPGWRAAAPCSCPPRWPPSTPCWTPPRRPCARRC